MIYVRKIFLLILFVFIPLITSGQNTQLLDSLEVALEETNNVEEKISILLDLTQKYEYKNLDTALGFARQAHVLASKSNLIDQEAKVNLVIANLFLIYQDVEKSLDHIYESLRLYEEVDNREGVSDSYNAIGIAYYMQSNFDKAFEYFEKSYNINNELGNKIALATDLNNLGNVYLSKGEYEKCIPYYLDAIKINKEIGDLFGQGINFLNLGESYYKQGRKEASLNYYNKALEIAKKINKHELITTTQNNIASFYLENNDFKNGILFASESLKISKKFNLKKNIYNAAKILQEAYLGEKNLDSAYKYAIIQYSMKDSLDIEEATQKITRLELQYEFEKREQEKKLEQKKKETAYILAIIISVSIFMVILILLIARHRVRVKKNNLEKKEIEGKLELKNKELTINVMSLMKKNEMLTGISTELFEIRNKAIKEETKNAINRISRKIKQSSESEIWEEFELRFKEVYSEFYENLLHRFPNLSPSEQKLCAFLRLNMSSKDISELTGQSLSSLEKARYRLRKKMKLTSSQINLVTFLSKI